MTIQYLKGSVSNISATSNNDILDAQNEQVVVPAGALIRTISLSGENMSAGATFSIGWNSNNDGIVGASVGVTSDLLMQSNQLVSRGGLNGATPGSYAMRLYSSADVTGTVKMIIAYTIFENDF